MRTRGRVIDREQLHDLVWTKPLRRAARDLGVAAHTLTRACDVLAVPRPPQGHWTQVALGRTPERVALPDREPDTPVDFELRPPAAPEPPRADAPTLEVPARLSHAHPIIQALSKAMLPSHRDAGLLVVRGIHQTVLRLSTASRARGLLIVDVLLKQFERRGKTVQLRSGDPHRYALEILDGEYVGELSVTEHLNRSAHRPIPGKEERYSFLTPRYDYEPSGVLTLELRGPWGRFREHWSDTAKRRVEQVLGAALVAFDVAASGWKAKQALEKAEADAARAREAEAQRIEAARARTAARARAKERAEQAMIEELESAATRWRRAQSLRAFVLAAARAVPEEDITPDFAEWLTWASGTATELDPLSRPHDLAVAFKVAKARVDVG